MREINYNVPLNIVYDMFEDIQDYTEYQFDYVRIWRKYMWLDELEKPWAKDITDEYYSRLKFVWNKICELDRRLLDCCNMVGIGNRFKLFQVARIIKNRGISVDNEQVERIIDELGDWEYNGGEYAPSELKTMLRKANWMALKEFIR